MALDDLIDIDENNDNVDQESKTNNDDNAIDKVRRKLFLKEYNTDGNRIEPPENRRSVPNEFKDGWVDVTDGIKEARIKSTGHLVQFTICKCGNKVIFWTRGPWYRCYECNRILINFDWKEKWWKNNSGQSGLDQFS